MTTAIRDYASLVRRLEGLPLQKDGLRRVYRGQTGDFPAMLPSDCRPGSPKTGKIWDVALLRLRDSLFGQSKRRPTPDGVDGTERALEVLRNVGVWFKVLAQHYGPGSPFLDVTSSIEVALWFALNRVSGPNGESLIALRVSGSRPIPLLCAALSFSAHRDVPGWFYVLDVPEWNGESIPEHGDLIDLSSGPDFVATCPRVRCQHGGLVKGDRKVRGGDLSAFYVCPPIAVARDFSGTPFIDRAAQDLFPAPEGDNWYETFLRAPLIPSPGTTNGFAYRQSLGVYVVTNSASGEEVAAVLKRQLDRTSPLVRVKVREQPQMRRELLEAVGTDPEEATYVQIEMPLLRFLPPETDWNQSALFTGLRRRVQPYVEASTQTFPAVSLENVLIELSPLEYGFEDLEATAAIGAMWIVRREDRFGFMTFSPAPEGVERYTVGPVWLRYASADSCFELSLNGAWVPVLESALPGAVTKAFFVALDILRGLSPSFKPDAYSSALLDGGRICLPVRRLSTVLARPKADPSDTRLHFLRNANSREPYAGPDVELPLAALLVLESRERFAKVRSVRELFGYAQQCLVGDRELELPRRSTEGFSDAVAEFLLRRYPPDGHSITQGDL